MVPPRPAPQSPELSLNFVRCDVDLHPHELGIETRSSGECLGHVHEFLEDLPPRTLAGKGADDIRIHDDTQHEPFGPSLE